MRIQYLSDLHFEFHGDRGKEFVENLDTTGIDALVIAGDLCSSHMVTSSLNLICERYNKAQVIYVPGNHDFYGANKNIVDYAIGQSCKKNSNLHYLDGTIATINNQRFIGHTLWFPFSKSNEPYEEDMNDFYTILNFREWVYQENYRAVKFFKDNIQPGDIVVTHHLPTDRSIHPMFYNSPLNAFFRTHLDNIIEKNKPAYMIHGHTHFSFDYKLYNTQIVCNPLGYVGHCLNKEFKHSAIIEI